MKPINAVCQFLALIMVAGYVNAAPALSGDAWARASIPGTNTVAVYGEFTNHGESALTITSVKADVAKSAMIHETVIKNGMASMRHLGDVTIKPGETFTCAPGERHIMLMGMKRQLVQGDRFGLTLGLANGESIQLTVKVGKIGQMVAPE